MEYEGLWLIWSNYHGAWWGPDRSGYYESVHHAGRYTMDEAIKLSRNRTMMGRTPPELPVPLKAALLTVEGRPFGDQ